MTQKLPAYAEFPLLPREWPKIEMNLPVNRELEDTIRLLFYKYFGKESTDKWYQGIEFQTIDDSRQIIVKVDFATSIGFMAKIFYVFSCFLEQNAKELSTLFDVGGCGLKRV